MPVKHDKMKIGDLVLLVEKNTKRYMYPMGRVLQVDYNDLGESTAATTLKGDTGETVYRHASSLILLISSSTSQKLHKDTIEPVMSDLHGPVKVVMRSQGVRETAKQCRVKNKRLADADLI